MTTITLLEQQKNNPERVNVYLDGEFAFGLNVMDAASLHKGQQLTDAEIAELRQRDDVVKAADKGIELLSYRPRSTEEIRRHLEHKQIPAATIDAAIDRLSALGYLDDRQFARFWVENRMMFKPRGVLALRHELRQKGVANALIDEVVTDLVDEEALALEAARKRSQRLRGVTHQVFKQKIGAFLQRRGFGYTVSSEAINRLIDELEADDPAYFSQTVDDA